MRFGAGLRESGATGAVEYEEMRREEEVRMTNAA
jgi:hypothetical protein